MTGWLLFWSGLALATQGWSLSAVYDISSLGLAVRDDAATRYSWQPDVQMVRTCGDVKAPDGLRIMEAQALDSGLSSALAILLRGTPDAPRLGPHNGRVGLRRGEERHLLQPMVEPRALAIRIRPEAPERTVLPHTQRVRTGLEMEACLEHKTGRGWLGPSEEEQAKKAFLISAPDGDRSNKYFGGQSEPVPALLGAPAACVLRGPERVASAPQTIARPYLTPSDVWGASLEPCDGVRPGDPAQNPVLPIRAREGLSIVRRPRRWIGLDVELVLDDGPGTVEERLQLVVSENVPEGAEPELWETPPEPQLLYVGAGLQDVLAKVPYFYPEFEVDGQRMTLMIIPEWQLHEILERLGQGVELDAVGDVLGRPHQLFVQIKPEADTGLWPDLAAAMLHPVARSPYGYSVASAGGRGEVLLTGDVPTPREVAAAHRSRMHSATLFGLLLSLMLGLPGILRLADLWTRAPEERAHYWPGNAPPPIAETEQNSPNLEAGS